MTVEEREKYNNYFREYRARNREKLRAYNRTYNKVWRAKYGYHNEENSRHRYPEKHRARRALRRAVARGEVKKQNCEICDSPSTGGHHDDYSQPLKVRWLCPLHHSKAHDIKY